MAEQQVDVDTVISTLRQQLSDAMWQIAVLTAQLQSTQDQPQVEVDSRPASQSGTEYNGE